MENRTRLVRAKDAKINIGQVIERPDIYGGKYQLVLALNGRRFTVPVMDDTDVAENVLVGATIRHDLDPDDLVYPETDFPIKLTNFDTLAAVYKSHPDLLKR